MTRPPTGFTDFLAGSVKRLLRYAVTYDALVRATAVIAAVATWMSACTDASVLVSINDELTAVRIVQVNSTSSSGTILLSIGDSAVLAASGENPLGQTLTNIPVTWEMEDSTIATVSGAGVVRGISNGSTIVLASSGSLYATATVQVGPTGGGGGSSLYPNEPAGLSVVFAADGTTNLFQELDENPGWLQYVTPVIDRSNPRGTGRSLEAVTTVGRSAPGLAQAQRFPAGAMTEWYVMYRMFYDPNYENHGHKLFYLGMDPGARNNSGDPSQIYLTRETDGRARFITQNVGSVVLGQSAPGAMTFGEWHNIEMRLLSETSPGAGDGEFQMWLNGAEVANNTSVRWTDTDDSAVGFDGITWWQQSNDVNTRQDYFRIGELYISGRYDSTHVSVPNYDTIPRPPVPPPPGHFAGYPNQPSGMSQVFRADGTVNEWTEALESGGWTTYVTPVTDSLNPGGTGMALEAVTVAGRAGPGLVEVNQFAAGPKNEWYVMYRIQYDPFYENHGHKLFYLGMAPGGRLGAGPAQMYLTREPDGMVRFLTQNVSSQVLAQTSTDAMTFGEWHQVELHLVAESAPGAGDGIVRLWFDGTFQDEDTSVQWTPASATSVQFDGMYLWMQSNNVNTRRDYFRIGEFYISGK